MARGPVSQQLPLAFGRAGRVGLVAVLVAVAAGVFLADVAGTAPPAIRVQPAAATPPTPVATTPPPPDALFIGDSYTAGAGGGGSGPGTSFACLTADAMGWHCVNAGEPGTGYVNDAGRQRRGYRAYPDRIAGYAETTSPRYVVLSGGRNDRDTTFAARTDAARRTLDALQLHFPAATIVVVGPFWQDDDVPRALRRFTTWLRTEAGRRGLVFLDPEAEWWLNSRNSASYIGRDGIHPTPAGHAYLARRMVAALRSAGIAPAPGAPADGHLVPPPLRPDPVPYSTPAPAAGQLPPESVAG